MKKVRKENKIKRAMSKPKAPNLRIPAPSPTHPSSVL